MTWHEQARARLKKEKANKMDRYGELMKEDVCEALLSFCEQDEEFAQAVVQGGSFSDCMKAVAGQVKGNVLSDMKAFGTAVGFYFPGAGIDVKMRIDLCADAKKEETEESAGGVLIDLSAFF